jgi:hypothetical protein
MREVKQIFTSIEEDGSGVTAPIPMDQYISPFNVGFGIHPIGTATYTVQHTFDDPFAADFDPATAVWFNHPDITAESGNNDGNYAFPVRAIRLNVSLSSDQVVFWVAQAGI